MTIFLDADDAPDGIGKAVNLLKRMGNLIVIAGGKPEAFIGREQIGLEGLKVFRGLVSDAVRSAMDERDRSLVSIGHKVGDNWIPGRWNDAFIFTDKELKKTMGAHVRPYEALKFIGGL